MRFPAIFASTAIAIGAAMSPASASAQGVSVSITLGPPQTVVMYEPEHDGPWRTSYLAWTPVTLYVVDGVYYARPVPGSRVVMVYRRGHEYILPPRDEKWVGVDKRFDYRLQPEKWDYEHGKEHEHGHGRGRGRR